MKTKPELLLATCCGPCATHAITELSKDYSIGVHFWGSNIHPYEEYKKRLNAIEQVCTVYNCPLVIHPYNDSDFIENVNGLENEAEGGARCTRCFEFRLSIAAEYALKNNITYFATSLTVSPHKNTDLINQIGEDIAKQKLTLEYIPTDFKKNDGFAKSAKLSKEYGIYRQKYCGCIFSKPQNI